MADQELMSYSFNNGVIPCLSTVYDFKTVLNMLGLSWYTPSINSDDHMICWIRDYRYGREIGTIKKLKEVLSDVLHYQVRISFFCRNKLKYMQDLQTANIPTVSNLQDIKDNMDIYNESSIYTLYFINSDDLIPGGDDESPIPAIARSGINSVAGGIEKMFRELTDAYKGYYLRCSDTSSSDNEETVRPRRLSMEDRTVGEEEPNSDTVVSDAEESEDEPIARTLNNKFLLTNPYNIGFGMIKAKQLAAEIFAEHQDESVPIDKWLAKSGNGEVLTVPGKGILLYHTREHECSLAGNGPIAHHPNRSVSTTTHIWLCGVKKEYRRQGVMRTLIKMMLNDKKCCDVISVHLNRNKFPDMYAVIHGLGFHLQGPVIGKNLERFVIPAAQLRARI